jgi:hypothetical protein
MTTNNTQLIKIIEQYKDELTALICRRLQRLEDTHYADIDYERHLEREQSFLDALVLGLQRDRPDSFFTFVEELVEQRLDEGYSLEEFQTAFDIVEESLWDVLVAHLPPDQTLIEMLGTSTKLFRRAKDQLACVYLHKALEAERELEHLQKKFRAYRKVAKQQGVFL